MDGDLVSDLLHMIIRLICIVFAHRGLIDSMYKKASNKT